MSDSEFTFVGQKVEKITLVFGLAMTIWGAVVTIISESQSLTSLIPSAIGLPMLIVGYLAIGRLVRGWMPLFMYAFPVTFVAAVFLTIWAMVTEDLVFNFNSISGAFGWLSFTWLVYIGYLAIGPGLLGHTGINAVLRWIPPLIISMVLIMEPIIGSMIGWLIGVDTIPGRWTILGGLLMIFGLFLVTINSDSDEAPLPSD